METPTLAAYIQPSVYNDDVLAAAKAAPLTELTGNFLIIRFWIELSENNQEGATAALAAIDQELLGGWPLYQVTTGAVFLAIMIGQEAAIIKALDAWLTGMSLYPGNWQVGMLQASEIVPWLSDFDPGRLKLPSPKRRRMTIKERSFVQNPPDVIGRAVEENLEWLRQLGFKKDKAAMAKSYKLAMVSLEIGECTLQSRSRLPSLTVALTEDGQYASSFICH